MIEGWGRGVREALITSRSAAATALDTGAAATAEVWTTHTLTAMKGIAVAAYLSDDTADAVALAYDTVEALSMHRPSDDVTDGLIAEMHTFVRVVRKESVGRRVDGFEL